MVTGSVAAVRLLHPSRFVAVRLTVRVTGAAVRFSYRCVTLLSLPMSCCRPSPKSHRKLSVPPVEAFVKVMSSGAQTWSPDPAAMPGTATTSGSTVSVRSCRLSHVSPEVAECTVRACNSTV